MIKSDGSAPGSNSVLPDDPPPFLGRWPRVYVVVLVYLAFVISLMYVFTVVFTFPS